MKLLKNTAIVIGLIMSTTGFAFADGHEAPGSGYWSTVSQELKEGKSGTILYRVTKDIWDTPNAPDGWPKGGSGNCYQTLIFGTGFAIVATFDVYWFIRLAYTRLLSFFRRPISVTEVSL